MFKLFFRKFKVFIIACVIIGIACSDGFNTELYSIFYPEVSKSPKSKEVFYFTFYYPYGTSSYDSDPKEDDNQLNIDSWSAYTKNKVSEKLLQSWLNGESKVDKEILKNLNQKGFADAYTYVNLLLKMDLLLIDSSEDFWSEPKAKDTISIKNMYKEIESQFLITNDRFIKERYLYLLLKSTSAIDDHSATVNYYEKYDKEIKNKTFISDWSRSKYAGAFYHLGDHAKSFYEFAQVFDTCPSRQQVADLSIKTYNIPYSDDVLKFCKNENEKAAAYTLNALQTQADGQAFTKKIYEINPNHEMIPLLITREINEQEHYFYRANDPYAYYEEEESTNLKDKNEVVATSQLLKLKELIKTIIKDQKVKDSEFYNLAISYLYYLDGDNVNAESSLSQVQNADKNSYVEKQKKILNIIIQLKKQVPYDENNFMGILEDIDILKSMHDERDISVMKFISSALGNYYLNMDGIQNQDKESSWFSGCGKKKEKQPISELNNSRQFFAESLKNIAGSWSDVDEKPKFEIGGYEMQTYLDSVPTETLRQVINFIEDTSMNPLDKHLIQISRLTNDQLYLAYGRRLMLEHKFKEAQGIFKKIKETFFKELVEYTDCNSSPDIGLKNKKFPKITNPSDYIQKIVEFQERTESYPKDAEAWFQLAEAMINISYHGNAWILSRSKWSVVELEYYVWSNPEYDLQINKALGKNYYHNEFALDCIKNAIKSCGDEELCTKIAYLGAVAEKNAFMAEYYQNIPVDYEKQEAYELAHKNTLHDKYRNYFKLITDKYFQTQYAKMVVNECDDFKKYIK